MLIEKEQEANQWKQLHEENIGLEDYMQASSK
jgi:hypothetical protein